MPSPAGLTGPWGASCARGTWTYGLAQDVGRVRVSPVSAGGFPDPCLGIVCLRMSHLQPRPRPHGRPAAPPTAPHQPQWPWPLRG